MSRRLKLFTAIIIGGSSVVMVAAAPTEDVAVQNKFAPELVRLEQDKALLNFQTVSLEAAGLEDESLEDASSKIGAKTACSETLAAKEISLVVAASPFMDEVQIAPTQITPAQITPAQIRPTRAQLEQRIRAALQ